MIIKSKYELYLMKKAGNIAFNTQEKIKKFIKPGISTKFLNDIAFNYIISKNAIPAFLGFNGFKNSICVSINEELIHGVPNKSVVLKEGDVVTIDVGVKYKGYCSDHAWTYPVGKISKIAKKLLKITKNALFFSMKKAIENNYIGDISESIEKYINDKSNFYIPEEYGGHGIGKNLHELPGIPNIGKKKTGMILKKRMVISIEPMTQIGTKKTIILKNGTVISANNDLTAHFEHTIIILKKKFRILSSAKGKIEH